MLEKKLSRSGKHKTSINTTSNIYLYAGLFVLISSLIYMIINIARADPVVMLWFPFMLAGIALVFVSELTK